MSKPNRSFKRPNAFLFYVALFFLKIYYKLRYLVSLDCDALSSMKGPALILSNHLSDKDHFLTAFALTPHRPTFVLSAHFMTKRFLRPVLLLMHVITKRMFDADAGTVLNIMRAARADNIIVLFPEGRLTWNFHSLSIANGTADLIKRLKIDVYHIIPHGASLTFPKWSKKPHRGSIVIKASKLFDAAAVAVMSNDDIEAALDSAFNYDDEAWAKQNKLRFRSRDTTLGLDGILYKCPLCHSEWTLKTLSSHIRCSCGLDAVMKDTYEIENAPFSSVNEWYDWQYSSVDADTLSLFDDCKIATIDADGYIIKDAGAARCTLDKNAFTFNGTVCGEPLSFSILAAQLPSVPITVAKRFDIYYNKKLYHITPLSDPRSVVLWAILFDKIKANAHS